ncbi:MAG TPA: GNAT family protein [Thermotogota bacterium]|nr:GNAT family protein [Thermotogota bacterium]HRW92003.1 GNAT family protein [Thermotogota bacterium]
MRDRVFLEGERLYLRILEPADIEGNYQHWFDDPLVCQFNAHHHFPLSRSQLEGYVNGVSSSTSDLVLAMVLKERNLHFGNISLQGIDWVSRNAEFAIIMGERDCWGKGLSKEAAGLILQHGFAQLNLHRVYCGTSSQNIPMQRLARAMGFEQEGTRKQAIFKHHEYFDLVEFGLLESNWDVEKALPRKRFPDPSAQGG